MNRKESELIREEFINLLVSQELEVRLWLINNISNFICENCGEEIADCLCDEEDEG